MSLFISAHVRIKPINFSPTYYTFYKNSFLGFSVQATSNRAELSDGSITSSEQPETSHSVSHEDPKTEGNIKSEQPTQSSAIMGENCSSPL